MRPDCSFKHMVSPNSSSSNSSDPLPLAAFFKRSHDVPSSRLAPSNNPLIQFPNFINFSLLFLGAPNNQFDNSLITSSLAFNASAGTGAPQPSRPPPPVPEIGFDVSLSKAKYAGWQKKLPPFPGPDLAQFPRLQPSSPERQNDPQKLVRQSRPDAYAELVSGL